MWSSVLSMLLITIPSLQGYEDLKFKELHYKISKTVAKIVEESKLIPDPSELDLIEKTKKLLEEYIQIDISSGLPEQIALLELKEKADDVKSSEETQKAVLDGLEFWGSIGEFKYDKASHLDDIVAYELGKMESKRVGTVNPYSRWLGGNLREPMRICENIRRDAESIAQYRNEVDLISTIGEIRKMVEMFEVYYHKLFDEFDKIDQHPITFDFLEVMEKVIAEGKEKTIEIRRLSEEFEFSQKILSVKEEIQVMEQLRDGEAIQNMLGLIEKLEKSFEGIQGPGLGIFQWKIGYFLRKMDPIRSYLKTLKISSGDLTEPLRNIESCLQNYDFSMDFSPEEEKFLKIKEAVEEIRTKNEQFLEVLDGIEEFRKVDSTVEKLKALSEGRSHSWHYTMELLTDFERDANLERVDVMDKLNDKLSEIQDLLNKLDFDAIPAVSNEIWSKVSKIKDLVNCHSKIVPSEVKSLMDQPKEVWNFDPRSLENAAEVVYLFKEAYRFLVDQKPVAPNQFPLTREEVSDVTDGFATLEAILNFQKFWAKNSGNFSSALADELSHVEDISNIQFPADPQIDSIINFYRTEYQGGRRTWILKTLEGVKDTSKFSEKLEKMNEAIRKYLGPEPPQVVEDELLVDCFESTCPLPLMPPNGDSEEPVKEDGP